MNEGGIRGNVERIHRGQVQFGWHLSTIGKKKNSSLQANSVALNSVTQFLKVLAYKKLSCLFIY